MDYDDQRRIYSINMQPGDILTGGHTGVQQIDQQANQTRLLFGNVFEGAVLTVSPQLTHEQQIHHVIPHQAHQPHQHQVLDTGQLQMQQLHHETSQQIVQLDQHQMQENVQPLLGGMQVIPEVVANTDEETVLGNAWCLICNRNLVSEATVFSLQKSSMSSSNRKLATFLSRLTETACSLDQDRLMCQMCFNVMDHADALEHEFNKTKEQIVKEFRTTQSYHKTTDPKCMEITQLKEEEFWDHDIESAAEEDDNDPDVTLASLKKAHKPHKKRQSKKAVNVSSRSTKLNKTNDMNCKSKKTRGRQKKEKQYEEEIPAGVLVKKCPSCKKVVERTKFLSHLSKHKMFPCPFCSKIFKRKEIKTHIAERHQEEVSYPCSECNQSFSTFMILKRHCLTAHLGIEEKRVQCKMCSKTFSQASGLRIHLETIHSKVQLLECSVCKETFNQKGNLRNHIKRLHSGDEAKKLICMVCSKGFICPSDLRKHSERAHLKLKPTKVNCDICAKQFSDPRALKVHINALHTKDIQYPCPECKVIFHSLTNMVTHRRRMHSGLEGRKQICATCRKGFCTPSDLRVHIKVVHENLRNYVCDICNQCFKVGSHLKYHRRKHTGETPYECPHCGKSFHSPSQIADHVKKAHKTVYIGVHQRRRLNIPADAPPPPPGILPASGSDHKVTKNNLLQEMTPQQHQPDGTAGGMSLMHHSITVQTGASLPMQPVQAMMFNAQPQMMPGMMETQASNYVNLPYDQTNNQGGLPMVVRLLHDIQC